MIKVENVTKSFGSGKGQFVAVDNVSFECKKGEVFGLIGTNGAGKTTMMRMIATMLKTTSGKITVCDKDTAINPELVRKNIGILFGGDCGLYDRLSARENIEYFGQLNGMSDEDLKIRIKELCDFFGMNDYIDRRAGKFSKGMKQKTCFARAIIHNPEVMLFDEPTSGLDIIASEEVISFIRKCKNEDKCILLSSHDMSEVEELCDRVAIISAGKILDAGTILELCEKYEKKNIKEVFLRLSGVNDVL